MTYSFDPLTGTLTISGTGEMTSYNNLSSVPWYSYRDSIYSVVMENVVTSIGNFAFYHCFKMTSIVIPASVASIGNSAILGCFSLTSVTIPSGVTYIEQSAFGSCSSLTGVVIPDSVTTIKYWAFANCTNLTSVTILNPDCVIGDSDYDVFKKYASGFTLYGYSGSTAEEYAANTVNPCGFDLLAPAPDFFLPASLTSIEDGAFQGVAAQAVLIPKNIQSISPNAFEDSDVVYIYGFPGTAAQTLAESDRVRFMFLSLTDAWYARLTGN